MAAVRSGEVKTNVEYESWFWVRWNIATQSSADNKTKIIWSCGVTPGHQFGDYAIRMSAVTINGTQVYAGGTYSDFLDYKEHVLGSGELYISHNSAGAASFTIGAFTGWLYSSHNYSASATTFELPTIDRGAAIVSAEDFSSVYWAPVINFVNPLGLEFQACISLDGGATATIPYRTVTDSSGAAIKSTSGSWAFTLTTTEKNIMKAASANAATIPFKFFLKSVVNGTTVYSALEKKFVVVEDSTTKPTMTAQYSVDFTTNDLTGSNSVFIKGYTDLTVLVSATSKWGASIASYKIKCGDMVSDESTAEFLGVTSDDVSVVVTDSRGFKVTSDPTISLIEYTPITASMETTNPDAYGNAAILVSGACFYGSFGAKDNTITVQYRIKTEGQADFGSWTTLQTITPTSGTYAAQGMITGLDYTKKITFQARAIDRLTTAETDEETRKSTPVFYWNGTNFNFNTHISFDGSAQTFERRIVFKSITDGTYPHNCGLVGGNPNSRDGIILYDWRNDRPILHYRDTDYNGNGELYLLNNPAVVAVTPTNWPTGISSGRAICMGNPKSTENKFYILVSNDGRLFTGRQLNGAYSITWTEK